MKQYLKYLWILPILIGWYMVWPWFFKFPVPDESTFLYEGLLVSQGKLPYRDFFEFIYPGTQYLVAGIIWIGGGLSVLTLRFMVLITLLICGGLTLKMGERFLPKSWLILLGLFLWLLHIPSGLEVQHHLFSSALCVGAGFCLYRYVSRDNIHPQKYLIIAGFLSGSSALFTQSLGAIFSLTLGIFLFIYHWLNPVEKKNISAFSALTYSFIYFGIPVLIPVLGLFTFFYVQGEFQSFWYSTFTWLKEGHYGKTTSHWYYLDGFTKLLSYGRVFYKKLDYTLIITFLIIEGAFPILGLLWPIELIRKKSLVSLSQHDWTIFLLWASGIGFFIATLSYPNTVLIAYHSWLLYLLALVGIFQWVRKKPQHARVFLIIGFVILGLVLLKHIEKSHNQLQREHIISYGTVEKLLLPGYYTPKQVEGINAIIYLVRHGSLEGQNLFPYNQGPEFNLVTQRYNPTRYVIMMKVYNSQKQIQEAAHSIGQKKPAFILYDQTDWLNFNHDLRFNQLQGINYHMEEIETIAAKEYLPVVAAGRYVLFQRKGVKNQTP